MDGIGGPVLKEVKPELLVARGVTVADVDLCREDDSAIEPAIYLRFTGSQTDGTECAQEIVVSLADARILALSVAVTLDESSARVQT